MNRPTKPAIKPMYDPEGEFGGDPYYGPTVPQAAPADDDINTKFDLRHWQWYIDKGERKELSDEQVRVAITPSLWKDADRFKRKFDNSTNWTTIEILTACAAGFITAKEPIMDKDKYQTKLKERFDSYYHAHYSSEFSFSDRSTTSLGGVAMRNR